MTRAIKHVKAISKLEHKMINAISSLKRALEANSTFEGKIRKNDVKLNQSRAKCTNLEKNNQRRAVDMKELEDNLDVSNHAREEMVVEVELHNSKSHIIYMCEERFN